MTVAVVFGDDTEGEGLTPAFWLGRHLGAVLKATHMEGWNHMPQIVTS